MPKRSTRPDSRLGELGQAFVRLRVRWARQGRRVRWLREQMGQRPARRDKAGRGGAKAARTALYNAAWSRWTATNDELTEVVETILRQPARATPDLVVKFDALTWLLLSDDAVVDDAAVMQVRRFGRSLRQVATAIGLHFGANAERYGAPWSWPDDRRRVNICHCHSDHRLLVVPMVHEELLQLSCC
jgi:hypothetical protein